MTKKKAYVRVATFSLDAVLPYIAGDKREKEATRLYEDDEGCIHEVKMTSARYHLFKNSVECARCGIEGKYFALERDFKQQHNGRSRHHFNLYSINQHGHEVMMTKDHIIPKSKGGANSMKNYQTMCRACNAAKKDTYTNEAILEGTK